MLFTLATDAENAELNFPMVGIESASYPRWKSMLVRGVDVENHLLHLTFRSPIPLGLSSLSEFSVR